jgi:glycerol-3-phosphate dehydrogenase
MFLRFNKKIYPKPAIKKAIKIYAHLASFNLNQNKNYFLVKTIKIKPELRKDFQDEFSNYVLSLMKK